MNSIVMSILSVLVIVVLFAPRRWAILGMLAGVLYLTQGESINLLGLHLYPVRFLELGGFVRVIVRREFSLHRINRLDLIFLLLYSYMTVVFLMRSNEGQAYQIGLAVDATMCFFTFRGLIGGLEDFRWTLFSFLILLVPFLVLVSVERFTGHNPFASIGGMSQDLLRDSRPRCVGSFRHPILMGTLGASFLPLYIGLVFSKINRARALVGVASCAGIVILSNSGGPLGSVVIVIIGWLLWFVRGKMFLVRRGIVGLLIFLALFMKAPIWYLPAKLSTLTGGDGWHRSYLLAMAFSDLDKWWLAGMSIMQTSDWFPYVLQVNRGADITNQYLTFGISAGLGAIVLFVLLLTRCFQGLGTALKAIRSDFPETDSEREPIIWGLGVMLSMHVVNWFGVSYFDQFYVVWFMQLAAISNLSQIYADPITSNKLLR